jgi:hypothetical protein
MAELRCPKEVTIECQDGTTRDYIIGKPPATVGMKIAVNGGMSALPKIGDFPTFESSYFELLRYAEAKLADGRTIRLTTRELIDNHVPDWEALRRLVIELVKHNASFFQNGAALDFWQNSLQKVAQLVTRMSTDSSPSLSQTDSQRLEN